MAVVVGFSVTTPDWGRFQQRRWLVAVASLSGSDFREALIGLPYRFDVCLVVGMNQHITHPRHSPPRLFTIPRTQVRTEPPGDLAQNLQTTDPSILTAGADINQRVEQAGSRHGFGGIPLPGAHRLGDAPVDDQRVAA